MRNRACDVGACNVLGSLQTPSPLPFAALLLPFQEEHKLQSSKGGLHLDLQQVPKMLGVLRCSWAPEAFVVSFKLETDEAILESKATGAMKKYGLNAVVANLLPTRTRQVRLFFESLEAEEINLSESAKDIEEQIVQRLVDVHQKHREEKAQSISKGGNGCS